MICRKGEDFNRKAILCIVFAGLLWGSSGIFSRSLGLYGLTSVQMTCLRSTISAFAITVYVVLHHKNNIKANPRELLMSLGSGVAMFLTATCYYAAMQASSVSTAVMLMYTAPIFVMAFSILFLGEKCTSIKLFACILMIVGCILITGVIGGFQYSNAGIVLGLVSAGTYSIYNILTKVEMNCGYAPLTTNMYCFIFMASISVMVSNPQQICNIAIENPQVVPLMLGCGVCTCLLPYYLYTLALKKIPVGTASSLSIIEPLAATVYSVTLLDEKLSFFSTIGIVLILVAVVVLSKADSTQVEDTHER